MDLIPNAAKREWVRCPVCGEPDMRREEDRDGNALILCVNHACASNGGSNADALVPPSRGMTARQIESRLYLIGHGACIAVWNGSFDVERLDSPRNGPIRRVLSSGGHVDEALFDRADARVAELKAAGVW